MTLQEHYNAIKNGKGNKDQFLKQARQLFPQYLNQYSDFNTATNVLKSKQIISENIAGGVVTKGFDIFDWKKILAEEAKAEEKETSKEVKDAQKYAYDNTDMKNADNINFNEIMKGFYAELKDPKNHDKTSEEIKAMVVKNLAKDPLFYTKDGEFGVKGVGYTTEAPGLGTPKEPKGKHKSSGYGDIEKEVKVKANVQDSLGDKEAKTSDPKKVKEMTTTPQNSAGVKKMKMPGAEKTIKLKENKEKRKLSLKQIDKKDKKGLALYKNIENPDDLYYYDGKELYSVVGQGLGNIRDQLIRACKDWDDFRRTLYAVSNTDTGNDNGNGNGNEEDADVCIDLLLPTKGDDGCWTNGISLEGAADLDVIVGGTCFCCCCCCLGGCACCG
jgi:hypothetical protein